MSSTIYYKGTLKDTSSAEALYETVLALSAEINCKIVRDGNDFYIDFAEGTSEPLLFRLKDGKINWFCKWHNPENPSEYCRIFDLFIAIKPLFKYLRVDDDEGVWQDYLLKAKPCKIHLRELNCPAELGLLERGDTASYDFTRFMMPGMMLLPYSDVVYRVIARDFLSVFGAASVNDLDEDRIIEVANGLLSEEDGFTRENFTFHFPYILLMIWIGYCLTYRDKGRVRQLNDEVWGLNTNILAAQHGLLSVFLNIHSGTVNYKHAEMKRFAAEHVYTGPKSIEHSAQAKAELTKIIKDYLADNAIDTEVEGPVFIPLTGTIKEAVEAIAADQETAPDARTEDVRQSLEALVSMLDYLGFKYVGPEEAEIR